ncbi:hypothetical protein CIB84_015775 [Bambusicola thoracicus]|uniref:Peptidase A2 domain-containing protein n=1 Tax=Bambusicola thoracicus TaxID=9083 RepID=A0A2P4S8P1_BAMTH|nr:hypothetical protein CIB84_015775 [Bambusicola thoracicus]
MGGLLLGRSSASMMGLFVLPGVIDADYQGEIMIMIHTPYPPVRILKGQRLAQLVPLPQLTKGMTPLQQEPRQQGGFGSTGELALLTLDLSTRPKRSCTLRYHDQSITLQGLLDTGADTSIITPGEWPADWPLQSSTTTVSGVGGMTLASRTPELTVEIDGRRATAVFSLAMLPPTVSCLVGRDVLAQLGLVLTNEHPLV